MFREQQQRLRPASTGGGGGGGASRQPELPAANRRLSWQQRGGRVPIFGLPNQARHQPDDLDLDDREEDELIRLSQDDYDDDDGAQQSFEEEEQDWRQAAQMLTERDERRLLANRQPRSSDVLDMVAPINRRLQQANQRARQRSPLTPTRESPSRPSPSQPQVVVAPSSQKLAQRMVFTSHKQLANNNKTTTEPKKKQRKQVRDGEEEERRKLHQNNHDDDDDNSSLSFAQSGCQSILSAWRIKAANKAARLATASRTASSQLGASQSRESRGRVADQRPQSVLSQASSVGKKSAASTAYTARSSRLPGAQIARIPLGPKSAQHFVTNTRRRRRANELIMNTLEARRRALSLNRSNLASSSLFGSESYLGGGLAAPLDDYQRLSMSPSPLAAAPVVGSGYPPQTRRSPSPRFAISPARRTPTGSAAAAAALSDLGAGRQSPAAVAQRNKLLAAAAAASRNLPVSSQQLIAMKKTLSHSSLGSGRPPLAKLDQNSSDLCSSNDSSSGRGDDDEGDGEDSDGSQFTQLVTSAELTPSCLLLEQGAGARRPEVRQQLVHEGATGRTSQQRIQSPVMRPQVPPPRPPERTKRKQSQVEIKPQQQQQQQQQQVSTSEEDDKNGNKLRRGALKRDSIRRMRLSRKQRSAESDEQYATNQRQTQSNYQSSSFDSYEQQQQQREREREREQEEASKNLRPLSKARKLDIENNPFLNRHHFRTLSTRSTDSKQSYASQQQQQVAVVATTRRTPLAAVMQSSNEEDELAEAPKSFRRGRPGSSASARASSESAQRQKPEAEMPQIDMENVRQVERMLRNMKPNETIRSRSRELSTGQSQQVASSSSSSRLKAGEGIESDRPENVFKTTTRLVRHNVEGARSSDDVKFDLAGNRQQRQLEERWRHERTVPPTRLTDGSVFSEQRFLNDRVEVLRGQEVTRSISPPAGFSDTKPAPRVAERSQAHPASLSSRRTIGGASASHAPGAQQKFVPTLPPKPSDRFAAARSPQVEFSANAQPKLSARARSEERSRQQSSASGEHERQQSRLQSKPPVVPRASKSSAQPATRESRIEPKPLVIDTARALQASLPKFERTADDEFRKRVDQLRQMARANLEASERRQAQEARARRDKMKLVKPMSTNWDSTTGRPKSPAAATKEEPLGAPQNLSRNLLVSPPRQAVATDLDDMLLADRYQRPLRQTKSPSPTPIAQQPPPAGTWRRSNSSLASLGTAARSREQARPSSPAPSFGIPRPQPGSEARAISPPSSVLSVEPRGDHLSATPMRVVVREKAAPRLDFAVVEQRAPVQHARPARREDETLMARRAVVGNPPAQHLRQAPHGNAAPSNLENQRRPAVRSPEFGQAAASSNDDSAIASSVSSPSPLSSYVASQPQRPAGLVTPTTAGRPPAVGQVQPARTTQTAVAAAGATRVQLPSQTSASAGALQSILRRQQLAAAAASLTTPVSYQQTPSGRFTPTNPIGRGPTPPPSTQQQLSPTRQLQRQIEPDVTQPSALTNQQRQTPAINQQHSLPAKRVHFNDRTSIRSFESISSEASDTTAIPQRQHQSSDLDDLRQQVGSPDSMGSGSTSRLSSDSPAFGDGFRRGGGGAAIYAIRGDPELEPMGQQSLPVAAVQQPRHSQQVVAPQQAAPQRYYTSQQQQQPPVVSHQTRPMMIMQPRGVQYGHPPASGYNSAAMYQPQPLPPQQLSPLAGSIRMTAPPTIKTSPQVPPASYQMMSPTGGNGGRAVLAPVHQQPVPNMAQQQQQHRPQQPVVMVAPLAQHQQRMPLSSGNRPAHLVTEADPEDDPDYALRLRQAATRRAYSYVQPQISAQQQQRQQQGQPPVGNGGGGGGQGGVPGVPRQRTDLANFQTEV